MRQPRKTQRCKINFHAKLKRYYLRVFSYRYGDRSPRGYAARVFAILWVLVGLVVISITTGVITTSLTAITLSTDLQLYGAKVRYIFTLIDWFYQCHRATHARLQNVETCRNECLYNQ
jgi:hypothetical protein